MTALLRLPFARLLRTPRTWMLVLGWALLALASAVVLRAQGEPSPADHVLRGTFGRFVLPLLAYTVVGTAIGGTSMRRGISAVVGLGAPPRRAVVATVLVSVLASACASAVLAFVVCAVAHGSADPPLGRDLFASTWVAALGGAAYAAYFAAGSSIGKRGGFRSVFLVLDFVIGSGAGVGAIFTPRGHVQSLLGGPLCAELSQRGSSVFLVLLVVGYGALAVLLSRRAA